MGKDEANIGRFIELKLGHDRLEIMAIGTQPMKPDNGSIRLLSAPDFNGFQCFHGVFSQ
jgi:hypothetical protein